MVTNPDGTVSSLSGTETGDPGTNILTSLLFSLVIFVVNFILKTTVRYFAKFEKHQSITAYQLSAASKLSIALFLN
jgi:hypothetical protein